MTGRAARGADQLRDVWRWAGTHPRIVLTVAVLAWFGPGLTGDFMHDTFRLIPELQPMSPAAMFHRILHPNNVWRAAWWVTVYAQVQAFGANPMGSLAVGIGVHLLLVVLVYEVSARVTVTSSAALAATLLFALLPQHFSRVYFIGRSLDHVYLVLAVWCLTHPDYPRRRWLVLLGGVALLCTFMSYEPNLIVGAPVVVVSLYLARGVPWRQRLPDLAARILPVVVATGAYVLVRFVIMQSAGLTTLTGEPRGVFSEVGIGVLRSMGAGLYYGTTSQLTLLDVRHHPLLEHVAWLYPALLVLLLGTGGRWRSTWPAVAWLAAWWVGALVPIVDFLNARNPESWYLFWPGWPLALAVAVAAADPAGTRRGAVLWTLLVAAVAVSSAAESLQWRSRFAKTRAVVHTFSESLPPPEEATGVYLLNPPNRFGDFGMFTPLSAALLLPYTPEARDQLHLWEQREHPHAAWPVPDHVPGQPVQHIEVRRWDGEALHWWAEPLPAWAHPQDPRAPDLAVWEGPGHWDRQGWSPNLHLIAAPRSAGEHAWVTQSPFALFFSPPLDFGDVPLAYAEVTMAVRSPSPITYAEWLFRTPGRQTFDGDSVYRFAIEADGEAHAYAVPIFHIPRSMMAGPIVQLALRPAGTQGALVRIDRIRLVPWKRPPPAAGDGTAR